LFNGTRKKEFSKFVSQFVSIIPSFPANLTPVTQICCAK